MNETLDFGWYYYSPFNRAPAWSSVEYFYDFMTGAPSFASQNGGVGPFAVEVLRRNAVPGDVIQYADAEGDWYHTVIISAVENGEIYVCAQSDDALDRPLSSYRFASARFLHIMGVRFEIQDAPCFDYLISGGELPLETPEPLPVDVPPMIEQDLPPATEESPNEGTENPPVEQPAEPLTEEAEPLPNPNLQNDRPEVVEGS